MPDPILILADLNSPVPFAHDGIPGTVVPQFTDAGSDKHHRRYFYTEVPADNTGSWHQIDAARLAGCLGDGCSSSAFSARDVAQMLNNIPTIYNLPNLLRSLVPQS